MSKYGTSTRCPHVEPHHISRTPLTSRVGGSTSNRLESYKIVCKGKNYTQNFTSLRDVMSLIKDLLETNVGQGGSKKDEYTGCYKYDFNLTFS